MCSKRVSGALACAFLQGSHMSHTLLGGAGRKGWSLSWIVVFSPSHEHLTFQKGGVIHQEDTVLSEMKQLFRANRLAVSITALSGTLKGESLLGLWKRKKKYATEKTHVCTGCPPPSS